jgi:hypothetical protein
MGYFHLDLFICEICTSKSAICLYALTIGFLCRQEYDTHIGNAT